MPNKRKCRNKECGTFFEPDTLTDYPRQIWCSDECKEAIVIAHYRKMRDNREKAQKRAEKAERKRRAREHRELKKALKPLSHWLRATQRVFNEYIVLRDRDLPCISSGEWDAEYWHAGHYRSVGAASHLRFNEDNCHKQSGEQNIYQSGNIEKYRINLIKKIGLERVEALENDNSTKKWTREELEELRKIYRKKIKELKNG
jgi:hypothetical protein